MATPALLGRQGLLKYTSVPFFKSSRKNDSEILPTVEEPKRSSEVTTSMDASKSDRRSDMKSNMTLHSPTKPIPARTPSTRIQEPTYKPSDIKRNSSAVHRSNTTTKSASKKTVTEKPERPGLQRRKTTAHTRYIDMLLALDSVPRLHNILASGFTWILLAGFIVFPATFNKLQNDKNLDAKANSQLKSHALATARNIPLLYVAAFACGIGVFGSLWLWWKHRKNYVWVINRVFLPALMNSIAGLISTIINIYSAQDGQFSITARVTIIVTSLCSVVTAALFLLYNSVMLKLVKRKHDKETKGFERSQSIREREEEAVRVEGKDGAGVV